MDVDFDFAAAIPPLHVEELAEVLPTCVCFHHEGVGKYFWSLAYFFDSMLQSIGVDSG